MPIIVPQSACIFSLLHVWNLLFHMIKERYEYYRRCALLTGIWGRLHSNSLQLIGCTLNKARKKRNRFLAALLEMSWGNPIFSSLLRPRKVFPCARWTQTQCATFVCGCVRLCKVEEFLIVHCFLEVSS